MKFFDKNKSFKKEFKQQLRYAIAAAVGFLIAYAWRESILNITYNIVSVFTVQTQTFLSNTLTALVLTLIGVLLIVITSKILKK